MLDCREKITVIGCGWLLSFLYQPNDVKYFILHEKQFTLKTISSALSFKWTKHCNDLCSLWQHLCTPSAESDLLHTESLISFFFFSFESLISLIYYNSDDSSWYAVYTCKFWFMFGKQKCCNTILSLYSLD